MGALRAVQSTGFGGAERRTLFVLTARVGRSPGEALAERPGRIERVDVAVPGAGLP